MTTTWPPCCQIELAVALSYPHPDLTSAKHNTNKHSNTNDTRKCNAARMNLSVMKVVGFILSLSDTDAVGWWVKPSQSVSIWQVEKCLIITHLTNWTCRTVNSQMSSLCDNDAQRPDQTGGSVRILSSLKHVNSACVWRLYKAPSACGKRSWLMLSWDLTHGISFLLSVRITHTIQR